MQDTLRFLVEHGYVVVFVFVFLEQIGAPLPAIPALLGIGALCAQGSIVPSVAVAVATVASVLADGIWYRIGALRGSRVLQLLCRISIEPDSCVRLTEITFQRWGPRSLLIAKFIPGFNTIAPPMAGMTGMPVPRFLVLDGLGALLYIVTFVALGWIWSDEIESIAAQLAVLGGRVPVALGALLVAWMLAKFVRRWLFLRQLRIARITPEELKQRMDSGDEVVVVDLRHAADKDEVRVSIPGAIRVAIEDIERDHDRIPRDREIILFCT